MTFGNITDEQTALLSSAAPGLIDAITAELNAIKGGATDADRSVARILAVGAASKVCDVSQADKNISEQIIPFLRKHNIYFAGADMLGGYISELNITSPTCLQEIYNNSKCNPGEIFWNNLI